MSTKEDPRLGLPSGSSALEDSLCRGRWRLQKDYLAMVEGDSVEDEGQESSSSRDSSSYDMDRDAEAGKRIHLLYAAQECTEADSAERERAEKALAVDKEMKEKWLKVFQFDTEPVEIIEFRERRWWLDDESNEHIYSGQTDVVWVRGNNGAECADILVGDLKGLWGHHDPATLNVQIRRYIAIIGATIKTLGFQRLRSAAAYLNQPAKTNHPVLALYEESDIEEAILEMWLDIGAMMDPDAQRTPGPRQCHRCRAKLICMEYLEMQQTQVLPLVSAELLPPKEEIKDRLAKLPGDKLAALLPWLDSLQHMVDMGKSEAKRRLHVDAGSVPGYALKKNATRSKVSDLTKVYTRLNASYNTSSQELLDMCSVSKSNIEEHVRAKSGLKGKALEDRIKVVLEGATVPVPVSDSLVPKDKA